MVVDQQMSNDAEDIAKNLIGAIVNEVMRLIMEQSDLCDGSTKEIKLDSCVEKDVLICAKGELLEKNKGIKSQNALLIGPHLSELCDPNITNLPDVCIQRSILPISSTQGEGDQQNHMQQVTCCSQLGLDMNILHSKNDKSILITSPTSDALQHEILENLHNSLYNLSFDDIKVLSDSTMVHLDKTYDLKESMQTNLKQSDDNQYVINNSCDNLSLIPEDENPSFELKKSKKFWNYNNTQYVTASIGQLPPNYCELVGVSNETAQLEDITGKETQEILPQICEVNDNKKTNDSVETSFHTSPLRNSFVCSISQPEMVVSSLSFLNSSNNSKTKINSGDKEVNIELVKTNWDAINEEQIKVVEPENIPDTVDMEDDFVQTRTFWSNTGIITETKVDPKSLYSLPDSFGVESIRRVTPLSKMCLKVHRKNNVQLANFNNISEHNEDLKNGSNVNYLCFPEKSDIKKKKSFLSRLTSTISQIFNFKKE